MAHKILIVDDSATTRAVIRRTINLAGVGATLEEAADGQAAIELLKVVPFDLVLADLHMPGMSGIDLIRRMFADPELRSVPVLLITAEPNQARLDELKRDGVRGYIRKPFTPEGIRNVITDTLGIAHA